MNYRFCGSAPSYMRGVFEATTFGQVLSLTSEQASDASLGDSAIAPAEDVDGIFTALEWAKYAPFGTHPNAPAEFHEKKRLALIQCGKFRADCETAVAEKLRAAEAEAEKESSNG